MGSQCWPPGSREGIRGNKNHITILSGSLQDAVRCQMDSKRAGDWLSLCVPLPTGVGWPTNNRPPTGTIPRVGGRLPIFHATLLCGLLLR